MKVLELLEQERSGHASLAVYCEREQRAVSVDECERCEHCAHLSKTSSPRDWVIVCEHAERRVTERGTLAAE